MAKRLQALALISVFAVRVMAPELALAQASPAPAPAVPPAPATPPPVPTPPATPIQPTGAAAAPEQPALPTYPPSATPPEGAVGPDGQPLTPAAAEPTAPPAYVEPMSTTPAEPSIQPAPAIDEQLVTEPKSKLPSYLMWGVGGASLVTGAVLGILAVTAKSDFNDNPTYAAADRVEGRAIAADVALGAGVVLLLTGTAFYFMPDSQESRPATASTTKRPAANLSFAPMLGRTNGGALTLKF